MKESDIQLAISALYDVTADMPSPSDDDYLTRRILMNRALHRWERNNGFWWDALWTTDATKTVTAGTKTYDAPTNFRRAAGFVDVIMPDGSRSVRYPVIKPNEARLASLPSAYFTGNPVTGYKLNLTTVPTDTTLGGTLAYDYYQKATEYTTPDTISEIPDPEYIIHSTVAELWKSDRKMGAYQTSLQEAEERLKGMEISHVASIDWQDSSMADFTDGFGL